MRLFLESKGGGVILCMKIQVEIVHLVTSAHKRCYYAAFSLLIVLSKTAAFYAILECSMQKYVFLLLH